MSSFVPALLAVLLSIIIGVLFADRADPLGEFSYKWGAFLGMITVGLSVLLLCSTISSFRRTALPEIVACSIWVSCGALASAGLLRRARYGALFALAFYAQFVVWPAAFMTLRGVPQEQQRSFATPVAILIATGYLYFRKRWTVLH